MRILKHLQPGKMPIALCLFALFLSVNAMSQQDAIFKKEAGYQTMSERWELDSSTRKRNFLITPYKPTYVTAGRWSSNPNTQPTSENPSYSLPFRVGYNNYEAKFQLSLKTRVVHGLLWGSGDLWVGYTQKAHWQVYNQKLSRPFRELNYEPEIIMNFATNFPVLGFRARMLAVSFDHQSNGRTLPLSRSWNRVILQAGLERKNWQIFLRPWIRLADTEDENPDITNYVGNGEVVVIRSVGRHQLSVIGSHSVHFTNGLGRGSIQANWVFPVVDNLKAMFQVSEGYGETLVDYNHRQTTIGLSVSLVEW